MTRHTSSYLRRMRVIALLMAAATPAMHAATPGLPLPEPLSPLPGGYLGRAAIFASDGFWQAAADQLRDITELPPDCGTEAVRTEFLAASAAFHTADPTAATRLAAFVANHPASPLALDARLMLADTYLFSGEYQAAYRAYRDIDIDALSGDRRQLYTYREALSMLKCGFLDEARGLFGTLRDDRKYAHAARFYDAYIDYAQGNLRSALSKFEALPATSEYGLEADFYILQIRYAMEEYAEVARKGPSLLERSHLPDNSPLLPETLKAIGLSHFKLDQKGEARRWLERYHGMAGEATDRTALYALGTILYEDGDLTGAADLFGRVTDDNDDLAQGAWLYLGQTALADGDESTATLAFSRAAALGYDRDVSETALYNYATASARGGTVPFGSGIDVLERFSESYPSSRYAPAVDEYLATAYFNANDYERALRSIDRIRRPSASVLAARQKILYELGMRSLVNGDPERAEGYLSQAASGSDPRIAAQSSLWLGDALYASGKYRDAASAYSRALAGSLPTENAALANYNLAYARHKLGDYSGALALFRKAAADSALIPSQRADASLRAADCLYYTGHYAEAKEAYRRIAETPGQDAVYASLRRATLLGREGDVAGKISLLRRLADDRTARDSRWMPEILESLAKAYAEKGDDAKAASTYGEYLSLYPQGRKAAASTLAMARSYRKAGQTVKSEIEYKNVIERWPASEEARQADADLRRIYAADGRLTEYAEYLRRAPGGFSLDAAEMEALTFDAAEDAWNENPDNLEPLRLYLRQYPDGSEAEAALYMIAESLHDQGKRPDALEAYRRLLAYGPGEYYIAAQTGVMRDSDDPAEILAAARILQSASGTAADLAEEASFHEATALSDSRDSASRAHAMSLLGRLAENPASLWGARAAVSLARIQLEASQPAKAEKTLLAFIDAGTPHSYWLARGYILLADAYSAQGKDYLARQYLESLRENYPGSDIDIHDMINSRLRKLKK